MDWLKLETPPETGGAPSSLAVPPRMLKREAEEASLSMAEERSEMDVELGRAPELTSLKVDSVTSLGLAEHTASDGALSPKTKTTTKVHKKASTKNRNKAKKRKRSETPNEDAIIRKSSRNTTTFDSRKVIVPSSSSVVCRSTNICRPSSKTRLDLASKTTKPKQDKRKNLADNDSTEMVVPGPSDFGKFMGGFYQLVHNSQGSESTSSDVSRKLDSLIEAVKGLPTLEQITAAQEAALKRMQEETIQTTNAICQKTMNQVKFYMDKISTSVKRQEGLVESVPPKRPIKIVRKGSGYSTRSSKGGPWPPSLSAAPPPMPQTRLIKSWGNMGAPQVGTPSIPEPSAWPVAEMWNPSPPTTEHQQRLSSGDQGPVYQDVVESFGVDIASPPTNLQAFVPPASSMAQPHKIPSLSTTPNVQAAIAVTVVEGVLPFGSPPGPIWSYESLLKQPGVSVIIKNLVAVSKEGSDAILELWPNVTMDQLPEPTPTRTCTQKNGTFDYGPPTIEDIQMFTGQPLSLTQIHVKDAMAKLQPRYTRVPIPASALFTLLVTKRVGSWAFTANIVTCRSVRSFLERIRSDVTAQGVLCSLSDADLFLHFQSKAVAEAMVLAYNQLCGTNEDRVETYVRFARQLQKNSSQRKNAKTAGAAI